jgi:hypothetical protein
MLQHLRFFEIQIYFLKFEELYYTSFNILKSKYHFSNPLKFYMLQFIKKKICYSLLKIYIFLENPSLKDNTFYMRGCEFETRMKIFMNNYEI